MEDSSPQRGQDGTSDFQASANGRHRAAQGDLDQERAARVVSGQVEEHSRTERISCQ